MRLFSVPSFRFSIADPTSAIGKWSRVATFGPKSKDGAKMVFDATTLGEMVDNAAARGDRIAICNDHASAYPETRDAPALGFFHALAVVASGAVVKHWAFDGGAAPDASAMEDGLYARLGEVTPRGADPLVGLANYRTCSPMFVTQGADETGRPTGYALLDVGATNVPFQAGAELVFHRTGEVARANGAQTMGEVRPGECGAPEPGSDVKCQKPKGHSGPHAGAADHWRGDPRGGNLRFWSAATEGAQAMASFEVGDRVRGNSRSVYPGKTGTVTNWGGNSGWVRWDDNPGGSGSIVRSSEIEKLSATAAASGTGAQTMGDEPMKHYFVPTIGAEDQCGRCGRPRGGPAHYPTTYSKGDNMDPKIATKLGLAAGATDADAKAAIKKFHAEAPMKMGAMDPAACAAMADDLDLMAGLAGDEDAKSMRGLAKKFRKMGLPDAAPAPVDDDKKKDEAEAMAAKFSALEGANQAMAAQLATLQSAEAARAAEAAKVKETEVETFMASVKQAGYPEASLPALKKTAMSNLADAQQIVAPLVSANKQLFSRMTSGGAPIAGARPGTVAPTSEKNGVIRFGMDLANEIRLHREKNPSMSYEDAAAVVAKAQPHLVDGYYQNQR